MVPIRLVLLLSSISLALLLFAKRHDILPGIRWPTWIVTEKWDGSTTGANMLASADLLMDYLDHYQIEDPVPIPVSPLDCTMAECFTYTQCGEDRFKVFVYPESEPVSPIYGNILLALRRSHYYTDKPDEACLFVLGLDTVDRDELSTVVYVRDLNEKIRLDPLVQQFWNDGRNHVIFNLYSGTWREYREKDLGFNIGYAILAKASMSVSVSLKLPTSKANFIKYVVVVLLFGRSIN